MKKRTIALLMAVVMLFGATVGGTIAWLQAESNKVENTFTIGEIAISLDETDYDDSTPDKDRDTENKYKIVPGNTYVKDPLVTVAKGSEECYVYVEIVETANNFGNDKYVQYAINTADWTNITGTNVYYYKDKVNALENEVAMTSTVLATDEDGNHITINPAITADDMTAAAAAKIEFFAYAVQAANMADAATAWTSTFGAPATTNP